MTTAFFKIILTRNRRRIWTECGRFTCAFSRKNFIKSRFLKHRQAVFKCGETSLTIDYQLNPRIELTDETVRQKIADIREKGVAVAKSPLANFDEFHPLCSLISLSRPR